MYLVPDVNAFITQRGGIMGFGSRRVMGLGLPLMHALTVSELSAVLAHEFGHFQGGDAILGSWVSSVGAGHVVVLTKGDASVEPFAVVGALAEGSMTGEQHAALMRDLGVAARPLASASGWVENRSIALSPNTGAPPPR